MRSLVGLLAFATALACGAHAAAQDRVAARLEYTRGPGAERCPDAETLQGNVAARLGYDPFQIDANVAVITSVSRGAHGLRAHVELRNAAGAVVGARELTAASTDCTALASAIVLAVTIAIDPLALSRPTPIAASPSQPPSPSPPPVAASPAPPEPSPARVVAAPVVVAPPPPRETPHVDPVVLHASIGVLASVGQTPSVTAGPTAQFGLRYRAFSAGIEGRIDLPGSRTVDGVGTATASVYSVALIPCLRYPLAPRFALLVCAVGSVGVMFGTASGVTNATPGSTLFVAAGARAGVEIDLVGPFSLRLHADILATLTPTSLRIMDGARQIEVWQSPPISGDVGAAFVVRFP